MKKILFTLLAVTNFFPAVAKACEGCKMAAANGFIEPQTTMAGMALSWSVLFMLAVVFLLLAGFIWSAWIACQKANSMHQE